MERKSFIVLLALLFISSLVIYFMSLGGPSHDIILNLLFLSFPCIASIAGMNAVQAYGVKNRHGSALMFITLGVTSWFLGELIFACNELIFNIDPYPSIADIFYLAAYPLFLTGIILEIRNYKTVISPLKSMILFAIAIILSIWVYSVSIFPVYNTHSSFLENAIAVSYGIGDVALIFGISYILMLADEFRGGKLYTTWFYIILGVMFMLVGDVMYSIYHIKYDQALLEYKRIDLLWILSYSCFAYGLFEMHITIRDIQTKLKQLL